MGRQYRTANGKFIDPESIMLKNELVQAVGNMRVNARGDLLGPGGEVIKDREEVIKEYYEQHTVRSRKEDSRNLNVPAGGKAKSVEEFEPGKAEEDK